MSTAGPVQLDLAATASELAAAADQGTLQPLGLGQVIDGDGALAGLTAAVAAGQRPGGPVTVLAAATPIGVAGQDLRAEVTCLLGDPEWVTVGPPDGHLHADEATVEAARAAVAGSGCVVSVGSGTLTDVGKAAAPVGCPAGRRADRDQRQRLLRPVLRAAAHRGQADHPVPLAGRPGYRPGGAGRRAG